MRLTTKRLEEAQSLKSQQPSNADEVEDPVDILKTRFARGEITKEEFETNLKVLQT